ncbi:MAG: hypothetical protein ABII79_05970 [bacterium]
METIQSQQQGPLAADYVRMYYEHQFERMGRLEDQSLMVSNIVITITILAFSLAFGKATELSPMTGLGLPGLMICSNLFAISYINRAAKWCRLHQRRAKRTLESYAQPLQEINQSGEWIRSGLLGSRKTIQRLLHVILAVVSVLPVASYFNAF